MSTAAELRSLYTAGQLAQLDAVSGTLLNNPTALDKHAHARALVPITPATTEGNEHGR